MCPNIFFHSGGELVNSENFDINKLFFCSVLNTSAAAQPHTGFLSTSVEDIKPIKVYSNFKKDKLNIKKDQKDKTGVYCLVNLVNGNIYIVRGSSKSFKWYVTKKEDILKLIEYFKLYPPRSAKKKRVHLINKYYELKGLKAHKAAPDTFLNKSWKYFTNNWLKYEDII